MKDKIKQNIFWNAFGSLVYLGSQWLLAVFVVRILGYEDAGIFSLSMSLTNTFYSLANYGIRNFQVSDLNRRFSDEEYIYGRSMTSGAAFLLCVFYCLFCGYEKRTCIAVWLFMCFRICEAFQDVYYGIEQKNSDMKSIGISNILKGIAAATVFFLTAVLSGSLICALFMMFIMITLVLILYDRRHAHIYMTAIKKKDFWNVCRIFWFCAPTALNSFITNYILTYPKLAIEREMGNKALGIYSAIGMPVLIVQMAAVYIFAPLVVVFAEYIQKKQRKAFYRLFVKVIIIIGSIGMIAVAAAILGGNIFLTILFGKESSKYIYILYPLILCTVLTATVWFMSAVLTVCRDDLGLCVSSIAAIIMIIQCSTKLIQRYSYNGASFVLCLALIVKITVMSITLIRKLKDK